MANTPNMNLTLPVVGQTGGTDYATEVNNSLTVVDGHNHTAGSGVQIPVSGLSINSSLPMNNNPLINTSAVTFTAQSSTPANGSVYQSSAGFLYYVDLNTGTNIQITNASGVAGSPGTIANLASPASATYNSGSTTFVWQANTNVAANMDFASAIFRNTSANSYGVTVSASGSLASSYGLTLPTIPGQSSFMLLNSSGVMSASIASSGGLTSANLSASAGITGSQIASATITGSNIASATITGANLAGGSVSTGQLVNGSVTYAKLVAANMVFSSSSGSYNNNTSSLSTVVSQSITTSGHPVRLSLQADGSGSVSYIGPSSSSGGVGTVFFYEGTNILAQNQFGSSGGFVLSSPMSFVDNNTTGNPGTYTYYVYGKFCIVENMSLVLEEIK